MKTQEKDGRSIEVTKIWERGGKGVLMVQRENKAHIKAPGIGLSYGSTSRRRAACGGTWRERE